MKIDIHKSVSIEPTIRTELLSSMFEVPSSQKLSVSLTGDIPDEVVCDAPHLRDWNIGLIVGPSGSGKTLLLNELFGSPEQVTWDRRSVIDDFPESQSMEDISRICQSVGFNTIPSWLRPYSVLSNGERFRVETARCLLSSRNPVVIDEFTSVVDRGVAQFACHSIQKYVRGAQKKLVVASCHYDILDWLQPDWILEPGNPCRFTWRSLQPRPSISCKVQRVKYETWELFREFHYMTQELNKAARCYGLYVSSTDSSGLESGLSNDGIQTHLDECVDSNGLSGHSRISSYSPENRTGNSGLVFHADNRTKSQFPSPESSSSYPSHPFGPGDSRDNKETERRFAEDESVDKLSTEEVRRVRRQEEESIKNRLFDGSAESSGPEEYKSVLPTSERSSLRLAKIGRLDGRPDDNLGSTSQTYRIASMCGVLYRPHPRVSDIYGFTRMVTLPDFQGLGLAFVLACKVASAYKALGKRLHSYPNHPAWIRSYQRSKDWIQIKNAGQFSPKRGESSTVSGFGGRRCAVFQYIGDAMNKEEAERLINAD